MAEQSWNDGTRIDWDRVRATRPGDLPEPARPPRPPVRPAPVAEVSAKVTRVHCLGPACIHTGHAFVPDPNRWIAVLDGIETHAVLGWRYCPATDDGHPVVATVRGVGVLDTSGQRFELQPR